MKKILLVEIGKQGDKYINNINERQIFIFDLNKSILLKKKRNNSSLKIVYDLDKFLKENGSIDTIISTPTNSHYELITKLSKYNCKILCEKPVISFHENFNKVNKNRYIKKNKKNIYGAYILRSSDQVKEFKSEALKSYKKKQIDYGFFYLSGSGGHVPWKHFRSLSGGVTNEISSHIIDLAIFIFGMPKKIKLCHQAQIRKKRFFKTSNQVINTKSRDTNYFHLFYKNLDIFVKTDFLSMKVFNFLICSGEKKYLRTSFTDENLNIDCKYKKNNFYISQLNDFFRKKPKYLHKFEETLKLLKLFNEKK